MIDLTCAYCGTTEGPFSLDHVVPRSRGGPDAPCNLINACRPCNLEKSDRLPSEWLETVSPEVAAIEERVSARVEVAVRSRRGRKEAEERADEARYYQAIHDPFEVWLSGAQDFGAPSRFTEAAIAVRDSLDAAERIVRSEAYRAELRSEKPVIDAASMLELCRLILQEARKR